MKRTLTLSAALLGTLALPAFAGSPEIGYSEPAPMAPAVVQAPVASHDWTGFSFGGQFGYGKVDSDNPDREAGDALYGLRSYYDYDLGNFVVGGGVQYDATNIDLGPTAVDGILRVGGRAGADLGSTFAYGTAGYAKAFTDDNAFGDSNGYFAGIGAESMVARNVSVGGEVLYHKFEDFDAKAFEASATTANISLNYRF
ncbi:outer membrane protein [Puniceibacterium confluentis]|uniref:outer membrane protein n=1 Tax=Puniceibacterium confluentis TaxID=1958944 RepID=UPI0011B68BB9|nr:outer membrane beta-barrel protein [Puniceibacterium confluentis]